MPSHPCVAAGMAANEAAAAALCRSAGGTPTCGLAPATCPTSSKRRVTTLQSRACPAAWRCGVELVVALVCTWAHVCKHVCVCARARPRARACVGAWPPGMYPLPAFHMHIHLHRHFHSQAVSLDMFSNQPFPSSDVITMSQILHDWGLPRKRLLLCKASKGTCICLAAFLCSLPCIEQRSLHCAAQPACSRPPPTRF